MRVHTIVVSTQHDEFVAPELGNMSYDEAVKQFGLERVDKAMHDKIEKDVRDDVLGQRAFAIGVARPVSFFVNSYGSAKNGLSDAIIAEKVGEIFDLRPAKIIEKFQLKNPIYEPTASYGHVGRKPYTKAVKVIRDGKEVEKVLQFFGWELLDAVPKVKEAFGL